MRSKDIGTRFETACVNYLRHNGFPHAERRALAGAHDLGDITGVPGVVFECKAGQAAKSASDGQVAAWMAETETERVNASADVGVLVLARPGVGMTRAGLNWAILRAENVLGEGYAGHELRVRLITACIWLRASGYGDALPFAWQTTPVTPDAPLPPLLRGSETPDDAA